ncbi:MAG: ABC transporter permease [Bacteroidales bacterium]|jgi:putative ABC transport system permease protein
MIKNYFKTALAHLKRNITYAFISILSLTIGLAVCILLLLYVRYELSYDRFNKNADHIYRLCQPGAVYQSPQTAKLLADKIPEIKDYTRLLPRYNEIVEYKENRFKETAVTYTDAGLFRIFSFKFKQGNPESALSDPLTIVISEKTARKYFGNEDPMGKILKLNSEENYTITGVLEDMPQNSHFRYEIFITLAGTENEEAFSNWGWQNFLVYFLFQDHFSQPDVEAKCSQLLKNPNEPNAPLIKYTIQNLKDIHLYSAHIKNDIQPQNSITYVLIFSAIGFLVLLISCFNYINLLTANATTQVIEIGMRKASGASRFQLAIQYISESFLVVFLSFCLSLLIVGFCLPIFNELSGKDLTILSLTRINTIWGILGILFTVGIVAVWYPAFILSSYDPTKVLKASKSTGESKFQFKKILVGAQFTIVIVLITSSIVMFRQIRFLQNTDLGFDKENVITSEVQTFGNEEKYMTLKRALLDQSMVVCVSAGSRIPSEDLSNYGGVIPQGQEKPITIPYAHVHFDYLNTLDIKVVKGRLFSDEYRTDATEAVILNEAAVKSLEIQGDPIGQSLKCNWPRSDRKIVGIVRDFHFESLYKKNKPAVFVIAFNECGQLLVKVKPSNGLSSLQTVSDICKKIYPDQIFDFRFLDVRLEQLYQAEKKTFRLMGYFAVLAIILSSMGLFGMASFIITSRTKEIGIRKANGAAVSEIMRMLNISFVKGIAIGFVLATPVAYYVMSRWLEGFAYRTTLSWWIFALAGILVLAIALLTVSWQSWRAATVNPVEALKHE